MTWGLALSRREESDELIADGRQASSARLCQERSRQLVKPSRRVALADQIEGLVDLVWAGPIASTGDMPAWLVDLRAAEVRATSSELRELAQALRAVEPPPARGVARAMVLVRHGQSPLYVDYGPHDLLRAVSATTAALSGSGPDAAD